MTEAITVQIPEPNIKTVKLTIVGTNQLIHNKFSEKSKRQMRDKQGLKADKPRGKRNPRKDFEQSLNVIKKGTFKYKFPKDRVEGEVVFSGTVGIPALWIKLAIVAAARNFPGVHMTTLKGNVFVKGVKDGMIPVTYKKMVMREDVVRLSGIGGTADLRYRGGVDDWKANIEIKFNADILSVEQVINLLKTSGFSCGLGEWRPQKSGDNGTFEVEPHKKKAGAEGKILVGTGEAGEEGRGLVRKV